MRPKLHSEALQDQILSQWHFQAKHNGRLSMITNDTLCVLHLESVKLMSCTSTPTQCLWLLWPWEAVDQTYIPLLTDRPPNIPDLCSTPPEVPPPLRPTPFFSKSWHSKVGPTTSPSLNYFLLFSSCGKIQHTHQLIDALQHLRPSTFVQAHANLCSYL